MNYRITSIIALACVFIMACQEAPKKITKTPTPPKPDYSVSFPALSESYKQAKKVVINDFYKTYFEKSNYSGGFLAAKNGEILYERYQGFSNYELQKPMDIKTPLHVASISKVMTSLAIMRLVHKGLCKLDDKVQKHLPTFPYPDVQIKHLLNHRSGLKQYAYFTDDPAIWNTDKVLTNKDILGLLSSKNITQDFKTNSKFSYCNTNFAMLALVVENLSGQHFPKAMKTLVFDPLDMKHTFVLDLANDGGVVSKSYKSNWETVPYDYLDAIYGDKNVYSTPRDLMRLDIGTYSEAFLPKHMRDIIYKGYSYERRGLKNYGLGIRMKEFDTGQKVFYHTGWWHGNKSCYVTLRQDSVMIVALSNKYSNATSNALRLSGAFGDYPFELYPEE